MFYENHHAERVMFMPRKPVPANPGRGASRPGAPPEPDWWEPVITRPDPVSLEEWLAWDADEDEPPGFDEDDLDPEGSALPWDEDLAAIVAETDQVMAERAADAEFLARPQTAELAGPYSRTRPAGEVPVARGYPGRRIGCPGCRPARRAGSAPRNASMSRRDRPRCTGSSIAKVAFTSEDRVRDVIRNFNADGFGSLAKLGCHATIIPGT